jgi:hypothetical protein
MADAQTGHCFYSSATFPQNLAAAVRQEMSRKRRQGLRAIATQCPARLPALTIPESKAGQAR